MALAALFAVTSAAQAEFITGSINFSSGAGGGIILQDAAGNVTTNLAAARGVKSWVFSEVEEGTGSFDTVLDGAAVIFSNSWVFNPSTSQSPLWTIVGPENFSFDLASSTTVFQNGSFLAIKGIGILTGNGFDATPGTWWFTTQGVAAQSKFSWSSSTVSVAVADGGTTIALFGASLLGLCGLRRKFWWR